MRAALSRADFEALDLTEIQERRAGLLRDGLSLTEIAKRDGVNPGTVYRCLEVTVMKSERAMHGIPIDLRRRRW